MRPLATKYRRSQLRSENIAKSSQLIIVISSLNQTNP